MANIEKIGKIKREALRGEHYFQSLLEQGYREQLLSEPELEKIQVDCLALLAKKTDRYNGGDSSSIRIEKAQEILASIMFTIGVQLKTYRCPDDAIAAVLGDGAEAVCAAGRKRIDRLVKRVKIRHAALVGQLLQTKNVFYASTITEGIQGFFKLYDPDYAAQEIHITADYPVYNKNERLLGIEFIGQYVEQLYYENLFCAQFGAEDVHHLLCGYDQHYAGLLFNFYELVLAASLGCAIAGTDVRRLEMTSAAVSFLYSRFAGRERDEIEQTLTEALSDLDRAFSFSAGLLDYLKQSLPQLAATIEYEAKAGTLNQLFILPKYPEDYPKLIVSFGEKMEDTVYRKVLEQLIGCQSIESKLFTIKEQIHSLADLEDLLLDAELSQNDVFAILQELNPGELAAFVKKHLFHTEWELSDLRSSEIFLSDSLKNYVAMLPPQQQVWVQEAAKAVQIVD